jgi:hypothetical protein
MVLVGALVMAPIGAMAEGARGPQWPMGLTA